MVKTSHIIRQLIEEAHDVVVVCLAKNYVEVKEELVANTESVMTDLASKAVEMVDVFTGAHYHLQRWYGFHTLRANPCSSKQPATTKQKWEKIIVQQNIR